MNAQMISLRGQGEKTTEIHGMQWNRNCPIISSTVWDKVPVKDLALRDKWLLHLIVW